MITSSESDSDFSDDEDTSFTGFTLIRSIRSESSSDECAVCEENGDFSHSNTMDTVSESFYVCTISRRQSKVEIYKYNAN